MKRKYRIWDGLDTEYTDWLTDAEAVALRRDGFYVHACA